jgi:hypothetical protein
MAFIYIVSLQEAKPLVEGTNGLSRFSDTPGDASFDDLFPVDKRGDHGAEASTSTTAQELQYNSRQNDLAKELKARMAEKQKENENEPMNGGKLLEFMRFRDGDLNGTVLLSLLCFLISVL